MMKYKGKVVKLIIALLILLTGTTLYAREKQIHDNAFLLSYSDVSKLESKIADVEKLTNWDIILATASYTNGKSAQSYGESVFDEFGQGDHGVVCVIDMDNREIALVTTGDAIYYLTDDRIAAILNNAYNPVGREDYKNTFLEMLSGIENNYNKGIESEQYTYNKQTGKITRRRYLTSLEILIAVGAAILTGGGTIVVIIGKYRLKWNKYKFNYRNHSSVNILDKRDQFVNQTVTQRRIPKEQPRNTGSSGSKGGSKSTVHTGSSGRTYGGGSKKF